MGYRSEVTIAVEEKYYLEYLKDFPDSIIPSEIKDWGALEENSNNPNILYIQFNDIKWYEGYDLPTEMRVLQKYLEDRHKVNTLLQPDLYIPPYYSMVRFGENIEDIETVAEHWEMGLELAREVLIDEPT